MIGNGFDGPGQVVSANLDLKMDGNDGDNNNGDPMHIDMTKVEAQSKFRQFLLTFEDANKTYHYRDQINENYAQGAFHLHVDMNDVRGFSQNLLTVLRDDPSKYMPVFEQAAKEVVSRLIIPQRPPDDLHDIQILLYNFPRLVSIRELNAQHVSNLVTVRGIVVSAGKVSVKATSLTLICNNCKMIKVIPCHSGFGGARMPRRCDTEFQANSGMAKCPLDPYRILADSSSYVDMQLLKIQEFPEDVPTGEMPRHLKASADRYLVGTVKPGTRVTLVGIYSTYESRDKRSAAATSRANSGVKDIGIRIPYLRLLGISNEADNVEFLQGKFNPEEEEEILAMSRMENIYDKISASIAPAIYGHEDIKKSICCMLFGGGRKLLPDGMRLRGDINILMLGDPSVGKSQFLKFAMEAAPIGVYTSGKGSSAAGLTASVIRDGATGEFHLEGGALVLADGGLVCIDEFDKMRDQDRVAIHEAMEQQTISIAKAGITTILNSRCSILAAANPVFSRYDDSKTATENIEFQTTILSRFDLIFIMRDIVNDKRDAMMATHIVNVHKHGHTSVNQAATAKATDDENLIPMEKLKRYVAYARHNVHPRLSVEAANLLKNRYVTFRDDMRAFAKGGTVGTAIPITVRQLEAIVRISESLAKMELKFHVNEKHVDEALRLFTVSTMQAATSEASNRTAVGSAAFDKELKRAESVLEQRMPIGSTCSTKKLVRDLLQHNITELAVRRALDIGTSRGRYRWIRQRKAVERIQ